jgi:hypothetical protein
MKTQTYVYIIIGILIIIGVSIYIGKSIGNKEQKDIQIKKEIEYIQVDNKQAEKKIDSLQSIVKDLNKKDKSLKTKEVKIREKANEIVLEKPKNEECNEIYEKANAKIEAQNKALVIKDTIEHNLRNIITEKDYIIDTKDRIIANKDKEIELTKELQKPRNKKYSIGIQVGYGGGVTVENNKITFKAVPYVGIGISRTIFSF